MRAKVLGDDKKADEEAEEDDGEYTLAELMKVVSDVQCGGRADKLSCLECFATAATTNVPAEMAKCATSYLLPEYKDCQVNIEYTCRKLTEAPINARLCRLGNE